jgi:exopolysaccharide biosynthesis polyprenyl glycosylphosphotransferase
MTNSEQTFEPLQRSTLGLRLPMQVSERRLLLMALDVVALNGALLLGLALRPAYGHDVGLIVQHPLWFLLLSVLWFLLADAFDAYDLEVASRFSTAAPSVLKTGLLTTGIYLLIPFFTPALPASPWLLFAFPLLTLALATVGRGLYVLVLDQPLFQRRALIVGAGWAGRTIAQTLVENGNGTYETVGFADDDPEKQGDKLQVAGTSLEVLGDRYALSDLIECHRVNTLVLAITDEVDGELLQIMTDCLEQGVNIIPMPVLYERLTGRVPVQHVGENWYAAMPILHPGTSATWPVVKRILDVVSAGFGAICLGLALPFIALAIYLDSPGPIFYTQERVGKGGERFRVYKFRSMVPQAEQEGEAVWAKENDDRVTRVGHILRKMHVDEFPQFFNILKGEMSAVGPRPERPEFVEELAAEIPFYRVRHAVKPGMAGWGLVKQGYGSSKEDAVLKLQYDLYYIKHQSLWLDVVILLKTILDTVTFGGR